MIVPDYDECKKPWLMRIWWKKNAYMRRNSEYKVRAEYLRMLVVQQI